MTNNKNRNARPVNDTLEVKNDVQAVKASEGTTTEDNTVDLAKLQEVEAKELENDGEKFTYVVGWKDDSNLVTVFKNGEQLFYGTEKDAEGLLKYANETDRGPKWEIIRIG